LKHDRAPQANGLRQRAFSLDPKNPRYNPSGIYGDARLATVEKGRFINDGITKIILGEIEELRRAPPLPAPLARLEVAFCAVDRVRGRRDVHPRVRRQLQLVTAQRARDALGFLQPCLRQRHAPLVHDQLAPALPRLFRTRAPAMSRHSS
jgi:hypothetical protein